MKTGSLNRSHTRSTWNNIHVRTKHRQGDKTMIKATLILAALGAGIAGWWIWGMINAINGLAF